MYPDLVETEVFPDYPTAQRFVDLHRSPFKRCLITTCNEGFIVDVYQKKYTDSFLH